MTDQSPNRHSARRTLALQVRPSLLSLVFGSFLISTSAAQADSHQSHPYADVLRVCAVQNASVDNVVNDLLKAGWSVLDESDFNKAIAVLGDGTFQNFKIATTIEELNTDRKSARIRMGADVRKKVSAYFASRTLVSPDDGNTYVNVFSRTQGNRFSCTAASMQPNARAELATETPLQITSKVSDPSGADLIVMARTRDVNGNDVTLVEFDASKLNPYFDEALMATSSLTVLRKRQ